MGVSSELVQVCPACGAENREGARFCDVCGGALTAPAVERRKLATLVFCDVSGSTAMGERVDAEAVRDLMLSYFLEARRVLERHGGMVEKFIGDAVVAAFGVPQVHEDDALRACRAALEIQARLSARISLRIGVNTGEVVAGDPSGRETFVTGDAVNVAARLEQAAPPGGVLIGDSTYRLVRDAVKIEVVEPLAAKGKSEPLAAYRLLEVAGARSTSGRERPLVGRAQELALLEREFDAAVSEPRCRLVTVVGEPGVGKSRLTAELVDRLGSRARVVRGACLSYGEGITFWAVAQIVRELAGIRDEQSAEEVRALVGPRIAQLLGLGEGSATADQMLQAIASFLAAAAAERPLVVLVDDIHWAEPALHDLLAALPATIQNAPVLLCCLARPELLEARPEWPVGVRLEPLGEAEVEVLLESLDAPIEVRERIAQAAAGNPLFAEELVAWAREGGFDSGELPTSLNALLGARLDQLEPEARDALERGAVEGELFHQGAVVELSPPASRPSVAAQLEALTRKDLLRLAAASFAGEYAFRFKHILFRDAAYGATSKKLRATLHEQYANWLESFAGTRLGEYQEIIGYHLEQAYRYRAELGSVDDEARALAARAAGHLGAAGRRAMDRSDVRAAAGLLGRATALLPADSLERLELMLISSRALSESGRALESRAIVEELYERATALGDRRLVARASSRRAGGDVMSGKVDHDELWAIEMENLQTLTELGDEVGLAAAARDLGMICRIAGRVTEAIEWFERAVAHASAGDDQATRRAVTQSLAMVLTEGPTPVGDAMRRCEELRDANRDDRVLEAVITRCLSSLLAMAGRFDDARDSERTSSRVLDEANMLSAWLSQVHSSYAKELVGDRAGAERDMEARWTSYRKIQGGALAGSARSAANRLAYLYAGDGRWADAEHWLAVYPDEGKGAARLSTEAVVAARRGELAEAESLAQRAVEIADRTPEWLNWRAEIWLAFADVQRAAGRTAEADAATATALELYEQKGNVAAAERLRAGALSA